MLTTFGKVLRDIRNERGLLLKDMADALDCSSPFLSAVETGSKSIPSNMVDIICKKYNLDNATCENLRQAAELSAKEVKIDINNFSDTDKNLVLAFARNFNSLDEIKKRKLRDMLKGGVND